MNNKILLITYRDQNINYEEVIKKLCPFPDDMKKFQIDHIIPLSRFDLTIDNDTKKAYSSINTQLLPIAENIRKSDKINFKKYPEQRKVAELLEFNNWKVKNGS